MANVNWRTINIDLLDPESPANFSTSSLAPAVASVSASEVQSLSSQIKQLLRGGDSEGALRGALENPPYGGDAAAKVSTGTFWCVTTVNNTHTVEILAAQILAGILVEPLPYIGS